MKRDRVAAFWSAETALRFIFGFLPCGSVPPALGPIAQPDHSSFQNRIVSPFSSDRFVHPGSFYP
jgi:hypothetical protein